MAFTKDVSRVYPETFGLWRVELKGLRLPYETNITVGEVIAISQAKAEEVVLNTPYLGETTPKDMGASIKKSTLMFAIQGSKFIQWRGNTGGVKTS